MALSPPSCARKRMNRPRNSWPSAGTAAVAAAECVRSQARQGANRSRDAPRRERCALREKALQRKKRGKQAVQPSEDVAFGLRIRKGVEQLAAFGTACGPHVRVQKVRRFRIRREFGTKVLRRNDMRSVSSTAFGVRLSNPKFPAQIGQSPRTDGSPNIQLDDACRSLVNFLLET
eukprot:scaffold1913_cov257-Pinguiococcus_pyrenoidosus.AAC.15